MYEITTFLKNTANTKLGLVIVESARGFIFRGHVPAELLYENATAEQLRVVSMGLPYNKETAGLFPKDRVFASYDDAKNAADALGYDVA